MTEPGNITISERRLEWTWQGRSLRVGLLQTRQAVMYPEQGVVLALAGPSPASEQLLAFDVADGHQRFQVAPPAGFVFGYLGRHPKGSPAVVCQGSPGERFPDWHYWVDVTSGALTRLAPAY